jgi:hypothetical protein
MPHGRSLLPNLLLVIAVALLTASETVGADQAPPPTAAGKPGMYNGPGSCAASSCHGGVQAKTVLRIPQNEYSIWAAQDKHQRGYMVLSNTVSLRIAKLLKLGDPNKEHRCLACHALDVPAEARAQTFQLDDGVSCENCHGPAVGWLGPHTTRGWTHEQSLKLGMYDTRNLISRSERCLSCHVGTPDKQVDHEMIAAGHPDLTFELDTFSSAMPRHWKPLRDKVAWFDVQEWAVGQAVQLRESLNRLSRRSAGPQWPEFSELECFSCHHSLTKPEASWRQAGGYPGRRPGATQWNTSRFTVFRHVAIETSREAATKLDAELDHLTGLVGSWSDRTQIEASAGRASQLADQIAHELERQQYDENLTVRIMQGISSDGASISNAGERSAEQAAMALDSLSIGYGKNAKAANHQEMRTAINRLFQELQNPSAYNAPQFAAQLQKIRTLLPRDGQTASAKH